MDTVRFYDENADRFFADTVDADMGELRGRYAALLPPGGKVLDAGCGSGRDAKAFAGMGFMVTAFDASAEMARRAGAHTGLPVRQMTFGGSPGETSSTGPGQAPHSCTCGGRPCATRWAAWGTRWPPAA